jgi:hypothetical protein
MKKTTVPSPHANPYIPDTTKNTPLRIHQFSTDNPEMNNILAVMEKLLHWAAIIESSDDAIISKSIDG